MINSLLPAVTGFFGAMAHVLSGPDHLAAVTPFAIEEKKKAWVIGLFWGLGHLTGMLLIGILFLAFKKYIPIEEVSEYSEFSVGFILIGIGVWAILKAFNYSFKKVHLHIHYKDRPYIHSHENATITHTNHHQHKKEKVFAKNNSSAYFVGTIHGFAGIAHFVLFLPILGFTSNYQTISYILGFALGTIAAMVIFAFVLGKISMKVKTLANNKGYKYLRILSGILAIIIGIYWIMQ